MTTDINMALCINCQRLQEAMRGGYLSPAEAGNIGPRCPPEPAGHGKRPSSLHGLRQVARLAGKSLNSKYLQKRARIVVVFPQHVLNIKWRMLQQCNTRWRVGGTRGSTVTLQCKVLYVAETGGMLPQSVELRWSGDGLRRASAIGLGRRCWRRPTPWRVSLLHMERILDHGWPDPPRAHAA